MTFPLRSRFVFLLAIVGSVVLIPVASAQTGTVASTWLGATLATRGSGWPPDTHGSVGVNHFIQAVNGGFLYFNKDGSTASTSQSNNAFWTSRVGLTTGSAGYTDPRIYFDPLSQRWYAVEITVPATGDNRILVGRSENADPLSAWAGFTINAQPGFFADYPTLGVDANALYIGTNNFGSTFTRSIISIPLNINGTSGLIPNPTGALSVTSVNHNLAGVPFGNTIHGVTDLTGGSIGANTGYVFGNGVTLNPGGLTPISRTLINNPGQSGATLTGPTTGNGGYVVINRDATAGLYAPQQGTTSTLDNGDNRQGSAIYRVGNLIYFAKSVEDAGQVGRSVVRYTIFSVNPTTHAMAVVQQGDIDLGGSTHAFYPAIVANSRGDFVVGFSRSSPTEFPSMWAAVGTTSNFSSWAVGTPFQVQAGLTFQNIGTGGDNRWGDYSAMTLDPADSGSFWFTSEYMPNIDPPGSLTANNNWGTQVVEIIPTVTGEIRWKSPGAGVFATGSNWQTNTAPSSASDHIIFSRWSTTSYAVTMPAAGATHNRLSVRQTGSGTVTFNLNGGTFTLGNTGATTPSLAVAEFMGQARATFTGGTLSTRHTVVAGQSGGTGVLTIDGSGTVWNNLNNLTIGGTSSAVGGTGSVFISGGASATISETTLIRNTVSGITVSGTSTFTTAGLTNETGSSPTVTLSNTGSSLVVNGASNSSFGGVIAGSGTLTKASAGTFTLTGTNTYNGATTVNGGTLKLGGTGSFASSTQIQVNSGGILDVTTGVGNLTGGANFDTGSFALASGQSLRGAGTVNGGVRVRNGSSISPGNGNATAGNLSISGDVVFQSSTSTLEVNLNGTSPGTTYDRLTVTGTVTLNNATLDTLLTGYTPTTGDKLFIVTNDGTDAVVGTFNGLPNGTSFLIGGFDAQIYYVGDLANNSITGGNDIVILFAPIPEPGTVLAVATLALGLAGMVRRTRRAGLTAAPTLAA